MTVGWMTLVAVCLLGALLAVLTFVYACLQAAAAADADREVELYDQDDPPAYDYLPQVHNMLAADETAESKRDALRARAEGDQL